MFAYAGMFKYFRYIWPTYIAVLHFSLPDVAGTIVKDCCGLRAATL